MARRTKLTKAYLQKLIQEERAKMGLKQPLRLRRRRASQALAETLETGVTDPEKVKAEELDASEFAGSLAHDVDYIKALKIEEARLAKKLNTLREMKARAISNMTKKIAK
jgi:hypothetical protein